MEILETHIKKKLSNCIYDTVNQVFFDKIFNNLKSCLKETHKNLLTYLFKLLEESSKENVNILVLNIHIEKRLAADEKTLIAEFLWYYYFELQHKNENKDCTNQALEDKIADLIVLTNKEITLPYLDPMATSAERKQINAKKEQLINKRALEKKYLYFYESLNKCATLSPKTLINLMDYQEQNLGSLFQNNPAYLRVENNIQGLSSFVLYNTNAFDDIVRAQINQNPLLQIIQNIILFDCENGIQRFVGFNYQQLANFNQNYNTNFKSFILFTFSNKENLNAISSKINRLKERYKIPENSSYIIPKFEFNLLSGQKFSANVTVNFVEQLINTFWDDFITETKNSGLYELRSIKMMNFYALSFDVEIKNYILNDIFTENNNPTLITKETKEYLLSLPQTSINSLNNLLSNVLDILIQSNHLNSIVETITPKTRILVDDNIQRNQKFFTLVKKCLNNLVDKKFLTWGSIDEFIDGHVIILSYKDQGNYKYHFYPNINELNLNEGVKADCILPAILFKQLYEWSQYYLLKSYQRLLNHPIRKFFFDWDTLEDEISQMKPRRPIDISWDLESDYSSSDTRITYRVLFSDKEKMTCIPSDLLVYREGALTQIRIATVKWVYENFDLFDNELCVQKLDVLIDDFNPVDKIIDKSQQNYDLEKIKDQFVIGKDEINRLWKIQLERKAVKLGTTQLYEELKNLFKSNNLVIVSQDYFERTWIQPSSESLVPRGNKVFRLICDYLDLPIEYRRYMYTTRNTTITGRRDATRIFIKLLKDLFNDGCFDDGANLEQILSDKIDYYKINHHLDELGIDENNSLKGLIILIELIKPELSYRKLENIIMNKQ